MQLLNIGYGNMISAERIIAIVSSGGKRQGNAYRCILRKKDKGSDSN